MVSYLILCRSLTYAQRTAHALERSGIAGYVMRAPRDISSEGCSYCVKIAENWLDKALVVLQKSGLSPKQVFILREDSSLGKVEL